MGLWCDVVELVVGDIGFVVRDVFGLMFVDVVELMIFDVSGYASSW